MSESPEPVDAAEDHMPGPPRSLWVAAFLSFLMAGLGHVYAGQARRGLVVYSLCYLAGLLSIVSLVYVPWGRIGVVVAVLLVIGWNVGSIADALMTIRRNRNYARRRYQRWWVYLLIWALAWPAAFVLTLPMRTYWLQAFSMPTGSMSDTIVAGDRVMVEMHALFARELRRGDVVIYLNKVGDDRTIFSKRIVGLAGDVIEFKDDKLIRNGVMIDEPYVKIDGPVGFGSIHLSNYGPITVPEGKLFMAGDHRRLSYDSRSTGSIPFADVIGHVMTIYWSQVPQLPHSPYDAPAGILRAYGIDDDNPPGLIRWSRIGKRIIDSDK